MVVETVWQTCYWIWCYQWFTNNISVVYLHLVVGMIHSSSLAGLTLIIGAKESGETHAEVVSHDGMLSCQSDSL